MVGGGIMVLLVPGVPQTEYIIHSDVNNLLGSCLMDMAKMLKVILEKNNSFSIERLEILKNTGMYSRPSVDSRAASYRAVHESLFADHFGGEIVDELFALYKKKLAASPVFLNLDNDKTL
ncbi:hypothetical protein ACS0TY_034216 [Phlomoides rotata]